jgi:hypothetical protein
MINHSSTPKELVHALKILNPKVIIADVAVLNKLHEALTTLDMNSSVIILTLIQREANYPFVSHPPENPEIRETDSVWTSSPRTSSNLVASSRRHMCWMGRMRANHAPLSFFRVGQQVYRRL